MTRYLCLMLRHCNALFKRGNGGPLDLSWAGPSGMRNFIPVRYGTVFLQNPGIPVFFGTVLALYSIPGFFGNCSILFVFSLLLPLVINLESCLGFCIYTSCPKFVITINIIISGEKWNKCNQCDFASSRAGHLGRHMKSHNGDKSNKCNQCDFASSRAGHLRTHLKTHSGEN